MYTKGHFREAHTALSKLMATQPRWAKGGDVYALCAELELLTNHDTDKASELLRKAEQIGCSDIGYYYRVKAETLWDAGDHETALQYFERSVATDTRERHLISFAQALSCARDKRALDVWQEVLGKDPQNCLAHIYVGCEAAMSGDTEKALLMAKKAEELHPSAEETFDLARLYQELREFNTSIDNYLQAKKLGYEELGPLYAAVADCHLSLGDAVLGQKYAKRALRCDPENDYVKEVWQKYGGK